MPERNLTYMKIVTVIGARPQFVKAAMVSKAIKDHNASHENKVTEIIVHTGQHFDENMSEIFFNQMQIPKPNYNLEINSLSHGAMTGQMLEGIEEILQKEQPDWVLVYGDTNSTLAGALAARKLHIRVAHVEAGLRSFNMRMPEEINRILTDRISNLLFCSTNVAMDNLENEGFEHMNIRVVKSGDIMLDSALVFSELATKQDGLDGQDFVLTTIHRAENTDYKENLSAIFSALSKISEEQTVVLPLHPRTKNLLDKYEIHLPDTIKIIDPVGYLEMLWLLSNCSMVITDSGGVQKEAFFFKKPCITAREQTEWTELVDIGVNTLVGSDENLMLEAYNKMSTNKPDFSHELYGDGNTRGIILNELLNANNS